MSERTVVLDQPVLFDESAEALRQATERAEQAEAELAKLKQGVAASHREKPAATARHVGAEDASNESSLKASKSPNTAAAAAKPQSRSTPRGSKSFAKTP